MDKKLQEWILDGAKPTTPLLYDMEFMKNLANKHGIRTLFYMGDISDEVAPYVRKNSMLEKIVVLNNNLKVSVMYKGDEIYAPKTYDWVYTYIHGSKMINFIDYSYLFNKNLRYITRELWKNCYDGSVMVIKNARTFLFDLNKTKEQIEHDMWHICGKKGYKIRDDIDTIILEKQ